MQKSKNQNKENKKFSRNGVKTNPVPKLWIWETQARKVHLYGTDCNDSLVVDSNGSLQYYNLQTKECTGKGGYYQFATFQNNKCHFCEHSYVFEGKEIRCGKIVLGDSHISCERIYSCETEDFKGYINGKSS